MRFILVIIILGSILKGKANAQDFVTYTSQLFFGGNLKNQDTSLLSTFRNKPELTFKKDTGWTVYPPVNEKKQPLPFYRFSFLKHPFIKSNFERGGLKVITSLDEDKIAGLEISFSFTSKPSFLNVYKQLLNSYENLSSKVIKRNVGEPFEVTKFISKDAKDFIIITKGENKGKPYIHISYNFQDYDW